MKNIPFTERMFDSQEGLFFHGVRTLSFYVKSKRKDLDLVLFGIKFCKAILRK
jgi:hypothetical protein